ncbi:hypothetical protein [uncultured Sneathia sp.]|uniref:hypothetical protein n=1 Tax=uncultured Sneathia sp. TaxID=278067 RepID=UPI0025924C33|nr:hypothetical protein [uncultured Sneathia sp.]
MKKTLLLTSLVASMVAMAGTTGSVEGYNKNEATFENGKDATFVAKETGVKTEVKVEGTGFSFGGEFKAENLKLSEDNKENLLNHSNVWAKYELPELKGVKSYVQAKVEPKFIGADKGSAELEGQVSYKYDVLTFGLNSKTNFPFVKSAGNDNYGKDVKSTHKVFVESEEGKDVFVKGLKDVKANVEVKHDYKKIEENHKASEAVDYVSGEASAKYDAVKDLELEGKVAFKKNFKSTEKIGDYKVLETKLFEKKEARYIHSYELKGTYTGVKHLTLSAKPFVAHVNLSKDKQSRVDKVLYGVELDAEYKMLNDKLTLTGKSLLAGVHDRKIDETKTNTGVFVFDANAKYDYSVTDKFTVSPEANANLELLVSKKVDKLVTEPTLTLTPKVSAEYKPTDTLTLKGSVEAPVKFGVNAANQKFEYKQTQVKTSLNLKYEWK